MHSKDTLTLLTCRWKDTHDACSMGKHDLRSVPYLHKSNRAYAQLLSHGSVERFFEYHSTCVHNTPMYFFDSRSRWKILLRICWEISFRNALFYLDVLGYFPRKISFHIRRRHRRLYDAMTGETPVQSAFLGSPKAKIDFELYYNETGTLWGFFCMRLCSVSVRMESLPGHTLYRIRVIFCWGVFQPSHLFPCSLFGVQRPTFTSHCEDEDRLPVQDSGYRWKRMGRFHLDQYDFIATDTWFLMGLGQERIFSCRSIWSYRKVLSSKVVVRGSKVAANVKSIMDVLSLKDKSLEYDFSLLYWL